MDNRLLTLESLCNHQKEIENLEKAIDQHTQIYNKLIADLSKLNLDIQAQQNQAIVNDEEHHQHLKPIQALKPSFILSFDHSPTELQHGYSNFDHTLMHQGSMPFQSLNNKPS